MTQGPLPFLQLVKTFGSGYTTLHALAGVSVQFTAGAYKFVSTRPANPRAALGA